MSPWRDDRDDEEYKRSVDEARARAREKEANEARTQGEVTIETIRAKFPGTLIGFGSDLLKDIEEEGE